MAPRQDQSLAADAASQFAIGDDRPCESDSADEHAQEMESFFEKLVEKPKGLLRVELRVYGPDKIFKRHNIHSPIYLFTDMVPRQGPKQGCSPVLKFFSIKGISPINSENWKKLVRQIWSQR